MKKTGGLKSCDTLPLSIHVEHTRKYISNNKTAFNYFVKKRNTNWTSDMIYWISNPQ